MSGNNDCNLGGTARKASYLVYMTK